MVKSEARGPDVQVIPAVDVLEGGVVRLRQGRFDAVTHYGDDPPSQVSLFGAAGADLVHVVDLAGARRGAFDDELWASVVATGISVQAGGGIRSATRACHLIELGVKRVVIGTAAAEPDGPLEDIVRAVGTEAVVAGLDVRAGLVRTTGWTGEGWAIADVVARIRDAGVSRLAVTGIETDGTMAGPDAALLEQVRNVAPGMAIIASGGVGSLDHVASLAVGGWDAVIVGRALYEGAFTLAEAMEASRVAGSGH